MKEWSSITHFEAAKISLILVLADNNQVSFKGEVASFLRVYTALLTPEKFYMIGHLGGSLG